MEKKDIQYKGFKVADVAKGKADWYMFSDLCKGCGLCMVKCPKKCLKWSKKYQKACYYQIKVVLYISTGIIVMYTKIHLL